MDEKQKQVVVDGLPAAGEAKPMRWLARKRVPMIIVALAIVVGSAFWYASAATSTQTLWSDSAVPQTITASDTRSTELGVRFQAKVAGNVTGLKFYKGAQNTGTHTGTLWDGSGKQLASVTFAGETASGWQTATFAKPIAVAANVTYTISYHAPNGHYSYNNNYFNQAYVSGDLTALANTPSATSSSGIGPIVGIAGKCVDDEHGVFASGNTVWLYGCNNTAAQQWTLPGDGTIRLDQNKYCLDVQHGGTKSGTPVWLYGCNNTGAQQWMANSNGSIVNPQSGLCLDDKTSGTADGNPLQVYACNNTAAQHWKVPSVASPTGVTGNGVYATASASTFPTTSSQATNYWVDVVFQSSVVGSVPAPAPPTTVSATQTQKGITVTWTTSQSQNPIAQYRVVRNGSQIATVSGTTLSYADANVTSGTTYAYQIQAVDSASQISTLSSKATITYTTTTTPTPTPTPTPTSGTGKYAPADGKVYLGVSTDHNVTNGGSDRLATFDSALGIKQPAIFDSYTAENGGFSSILANAAKSPYMTPEVSWGLDFTNAKSGVASAPANLVVTNGSMDANLNARIAEVKSFGKPVFIRLNWEFNGSWYPGWNNPQVTPAQYIASWQYVVNKFKAAGVTNVAWVWCPNVNDYFDSKGTRFTTAEWYPGDSFVDWVGLDAYPQSNTQDTLLNGQDGMNQMAQFAAAHSKPLMLNEWALNTPYPDDPAVIDWVLAWQDAYPKTVKANLWFDFVTQGKDFTLAGHPKAAGEFKAKVAAKPNEYVTAPIQ